MTTCIAVRCPHCGSWSGHTLLDLALRMLCAITGGYLIVDDTVVEKS